MVAKPSRLGFFLTARGRIDCPRRVRLRNNERAGSLAGGAACIGDGPIKITLWAATPLGAATKCGRGAALLYAAGLAISLGCEADRQSGGAGDVTFTLMTLAV